MASDATNALEVDPQAANAVVYVTSRRRSEAQQEVPLSVSTITGKQIEAAGNFNVGRLTQVQPALQFYSQNQRNTTVNLRGLGAPFGLTNDGIEQGVGFYIDDIYYARAASAALDFVDVSQVEVIRGPQGTLYGKNTTAGALNISTREPSFDKEGRGTLTYGTENFVQLRGSISGPISENVAARVSTSYTSRDGLSYNVARGEKVNELNNLSVRTQLLWNATDDLKLIFYGDYSEQHPNGAGQSYVRVAPTLRSAARQFDGLLAGYNAASGSNYSIPSTNPFDRLVSHDSKTKGLQHNSGAALRINWEVLNGELTSITGWRTWSWRPSNDRDWIGIPIQTVSANPSDSEQWQQEIRFHSEINDRFEYVTGLFYFQQAIRSSGNSELGAAASFWLNGPTTGSGNAAVTARNGLDAHFGAGNWGYAQYSSVLNGRKQTSDIRLDTSSAALFGRLTWRATDKLEIEPGLRYNYDSKDAYYNAVASGGLATTDANLRSIQNGQLASSFYVAKFEDYNLSGDLTISYKFTPDFLLFGTYAKTFKSGGINLNGIPNGANGLPAVSDFATVKPESINHYELGIKSQYFGRRITANVALYRTDIEDYQAIVQLAASGSSTLRGVLASVPQVRVQGIEIETSYRPIDGLNIYLNTAYTDGKYIRFPNAPLALENSGSSNTALPTAANISGQRLPGISEWNTTYGAEHKARSDLFSQNGEIYVGFDGSTKSDWSSSATPSAYTWVKGYTILNLRAGIRTQNDWDFGIWIKNATDEEYFNQLTQQGGSTGLIVGEVGEPRTYGISLSFNF